MNVNIPINVKQEEIKEKMEYIKYNPEISIDFPNVISS